MSLLDHRPRFVAEPTEEELAKTPSQRPLIVSLRAAALAWAEQRELQPGEAPSLTVKEQSAPAWETADALAWLFSRGRVGVEPPDTLIVRMAFDYTRSVAGHRLAELVLAGTGLSAKGVADAAEAAPSVDADASPQLKAVFDWLVGYFGTRERMDGQLDLLWFHLFYSFGRIARGEAEQRASQAEARLTERMPMLRRGLGFHRSLLNSKNKVVQSSRKAVVAGTRSNEVTAELLREFRYDPLGTYERLAMHALVSIARDMDLLDSHPWATASGRMPLKPGEEPLRVRVPYPGASEIARIVGHTPGPDGRMPGGIRDAYQRAVSSLINRARWIAIDVIYPDWTEDTEVRKDLWVRLSGSARLGKGAFLDIHPAAVASHLKSFENIPDLGAIYESARDKMGLHQLRDEFAIADDYLRYIAFSMTAKQERLLGKAKPNTVESDADFIPKKVAHTTLLERIGRDEWAKKQGQPASVRCVHDALSFCSHVGTILPDFKLEAGIWTVRLRRPTSGRVDADQFVALAADEVDSPK